MADDCDFIGYGANLPDQQWPGGARIAVNMRLFRRFGVKISLLAVARAAERNPDLTRAFVEDGHEIVSHGYRWLDYQTIPEEVERGHVRLAIETIERIAGVRPVGWMTGRPSANTRRLHLELGGFFTTATYSTTNFPIGSRSGSRTTSSSRIPSRRTTTASTRTSGSRRARSSPAT